MLAGNVLVISLLMATATDFGISRRIAFENSLMICAVTSRAANSWSMRTGLPLLNGGRGFLYVTFKTFISKSGGCEKEVDTTQTEQA
jgi:hypothetical protein